MLSTTPVDPADPAARTAPGRPRDGSLDDAILRATNDLLAEVGYARLTIAAVVLRAGTTKAALYRRWPSKAHLVHEAVFPNVGDPPIAGTGDVGADVRNLIRGSVELFSRPQVRATLPGLLAELYAEPTLHAALLERFQADVWQRIGRSLEAAISAGQVRPEVNTAHVIELISGSALMAVTLRPPDQIDDQWVDDVAVLVLKGLEP
jgi:AcrR family transcriptional regulator